MRKRYKILKSIMIAGVLVFLALILSACEDAGSGLSSSRSLTTSMGYFTLLSVDGVNYSCTGGGGNTSGLTNSGGRFEFFPSSSCTFLVGNTEITTLKPNEASESYYTSQDIWGDNYLRAAALLLSLDSQGSIEDGIQISQSLDKITGAFNFDAALDSFENNPTISVMLTQIGKSTTDLVTEEKAKSYITDSIFNTAMRLVKFQTFFTGGGKINFPRSIRINSEIEIQTRWSLNLGLVTGDCVSDSGVIIGTGYCAGDVQGQFSYDSNRKYKKFRVVLDENTTSKEYDDFIIRNTYIDFHSYRGDVISKINSATEVRMLVSESETPPDLTNVDPMAIITRNFIKHSSLLGMRRVYFAWTDTLTKTNYNDALLREDYAVSDENGYKNIPFVMKKNTKYYLHMYYTKANTSKILTHEFSTIDYPASFEEAEALFKGTTRASDLFDSKTYDPKMIERKPGEPLISNYYAWGASSLRLTFYDENDSPYLTCPDILCSTDNSNTIYVFLDDARNIRLGVTSSQTQKGGLLRDFIILRDPRLMPTKTYIQSGWLIDTSHVFFENVYE